MKCYRLLYLILLSFSFVSYSQETYKIGTTEYYYNQNYSTTGKPMVKRSESNKREFLRSRGYSQLPDGYEIDHITPLSEGGSDDPSNMQLLTIDAHKRKTANERGNNSSSTYSTSVKDYTTTSTSNSTALPYTNSQGRTIYTGSKGGEYYINANGNKVYVNSSSNTSKSNTTNYYPSQSSSSSNRVMQTGPKGGQYYINSKGNKSYVKKKN